ncbi:MAG: SemiSWEET transporter [Deltaproteobacteria bacterium]|nr:SemiSWEET transporter [Deltaproteobacteria bacterium]
MENWIGSIAAALTTASFVPQAIKVIRDRKTQDLSLGMYVMFTLGVLLWFVFGLMIGSFPVYLANGITLAVSSAILVMKIRFG